MNGIKQGASVFNLKPEMVIAYFIACGVYNNYSGVCYDCIITSGTDSKHSRGSQHPLGYAIDLRISNLPTEKISKITDLIRDSLAGEYQVILETDHIHIEFDPKYSGITYIK